MHGDTFATVSLGGQRFIVQIDWDDGSPYVPNGELPDALCAAAGCSGEDPEFQAHLFEWIEGALADADADRREADETDHLLDRAFPD